MYSHYKYVTQFGARLNGEDDDTQAIIDAMSAAKNDALLYGISGIIVPPGFVKTTAPIEWFNGVNIRTEGATFVPAGELPVFYNTEKFSGVPGISGAHAPYREAWIGGTFKFSGISGSSGEAFRFNKSLNNVGFSKIRFAGTAGKLVSAIGFYRDPVETQEHYHIQFKELMFQALYSPHGAIYSDSNENNGVMYWGHHLLDSCKWYGCAKNVNLSGCMISFTNNIFNPNSYQAVNYNGIYANGGHNIAGLYFPNTNNVHFGENNYWEGGNSAYIVLSNQAWQNTGNDLVFTAKQFGAMNIDQYNNHKVVLWGEHYGPAEEYGSNNVVLLEKISDDKFQIINGSSKFPKFYNAMLNYKHVWYYSPSAGWYSSDMCCVKSSDNNLDITCTQRNVPDDLTHIAYECYHGVCDPQGL